MKQIISTGIVLSRTDFQEADRILTILTPDQGKIRAIAKGVRRSSSKLAGGIELFSISHVTFLPGKKELGTLISTRLIVHYGNIVKDISRTMLGYEFLKRMNRLTEDAAGAEYFDILSKTLGGLNDLELDPELTEMWFCMQLLKVTGHGPNLLTDKAGHKLDSDKKYMFEFDSMGFYEQKMGPYGANHIRLLRLGYATEEPSVLKQVKDTENFVKPTLKLARNVLKLNVRI